MPFAENPNLAKWLESHNPDHVSISILTNRLIYIHCKEKKIEMRYYQVLFAFIKGIFFKFIEWFPNLSECQERNYIYLFE